jgi:predicted PurR-regulated permease PerM
MVRHGWRAPAGDRAVTAATPDPGPPLRLRHWAAVFALAIGMAAGAWLIYQMIDVVLMIFLGVTLAAALQPWHARLCDLGVPRALAVLLIYLLFALLLAGLGVLVLPALADEIGRLLSTVPEQYASLLRWLRDRPDRVLRILGQRLPPFEALPATMTSSPAESVRGIFGLTSGMLAVLTWVVTVLAVAFYWTLEVPRLERLALSVLPVTRRAQVLGAWREIETKLGGYFRAQGIAMLIVGVASGVGYAVIGLPNPLALGILAGLFEGIPLVGPFLAAIPALLAALGMGLAVIVLTLAWSAVVQLVESNVLVPRLMSQAVGVSELVSLVAILAFGSAYGILGVFLAIPIAAVVHVVLDRLVLAAEPVPPAGEQPALVGLRARAGALRERVRGRLRERSVRMGIDPATPEHVVDAADQELEQAVERIAGMIRAAQRSGRATGGDERTRLLQALQSALHRLEEAVAQVDAAVPSKGTHDHPPLADLNRLTAQAARAVEGAEAVLATLDEDASTPSIDPSRMSGDVKS